MSATEQKKEEDETEVEETDMKNNEKSKEAKGVDSVTDYVEEKNTTDESKAKNALESLAAKTELKVEGTATVTVHPDDVKTLVEELEISKDAAERLLRKNNGNLMEALEYFVLGNPVK